jgi:hypothetical protein
LPERQRRTDPAVQRVRRVERVCRLECPHR